MSMIMYYVRVTERPTRFVADDLQDDPAVHHWRLRWRPQS